MMYMLLCLSTGKRSRHALGDVSVKRTTSDLSSTSARLPISARMGKADRRMVSLIKMNEDDFLLFSS